MGVSHVSLLGHRARGTRPGSRYRAPAGTRDPGPTAGLPCEQGGRGVQCLPRAVTGELGKLFGKVAQQGHCRGTLASGGPERAGVDGLHAGRDSALVLGHRGCCSALVLEHRGCCSIPSPGMWRCCSALVLEHTGCCAAPPSSGLGCWHLHHLSL